LLSVPSGYPGLTPWPTDLGRALKIRKVPEGKAFPIQKASPFTRHQIPLRAVALQRHHQNFQTALCGENHPIPRPGFQEQCF